MLMVYAKDGKKAYKHFFKPWFDFIYKLKREGLPYRDSNNPEMKPFKIRLPQDASSIQKSLGMGGACKACDLFCHMCACRSHGANAQILKWREGHLRCRKYCLRKEQPPKQCFHWEVDEPNEIDHKKQKIKLHILYDELRAFTMYREIFVNDMLSVKGIQQHYLTNGKQKIDRHISEDESVISGSLIFVSVTDAGRHTNPKHIDYICPTHACLLQTGYNTLLDKELILRKMYRHCTLPLELKQKALRLSIRNGEYVIDMRRAVKRYEDLKADGSMMMEINDAILCSLHLELRINETKTSNVFNIGFAERKTPALCNEYMEDVEKIVNKDRIGRLSHQNQWRFPSNKARNGVRDDFSLKGDAGKNFLSKMDRIVPLAFKYHDSNDKNEEEWFEILKLYDEIKLTLNKKETFTDEMIYNFQDLVDKYFNKWVKIAGRDGMTNYVHFLGAGHVSHYLFLYRNLYKYSQQGFESMMNKIKIIYAKATSRGGAGAKIRSHILQISHFMLRMMMWNSGHGEAYFRNKYSEIIDDMEEHNLFLF